MAAAGQMGELSGWIDLYVGGGVNLRGTGGCQELEFQVTRHKLGVREPLPSRKQHDNSLQLTSFFSHTCHHD